MEVLKALSRIRAVCKGVDANFDVHLKMQSDLDLIEKTLKEKPILKSVKNDKK